MEKFELNSFKDFLNEARIKKAGNIPVQSSKDNKALAKVIKADKEKLWAWNGAAKASFTTTPYFIASSNGIYDKIVYGTYFLEKTGEFRRLQVSFKDNGYSQVTVETITKRESEKIKENCDLIAPNITKDYFSTIADTIIKLIEDTTAAEAEEMTQSAKKAKREAKGDVPLEDADNKTIAKWLEVFIGKTKGVTVQASKGYSDGIIIFWHYDFKPTIAKFKEEVWDDLYVDLTDRTLEDGIEMVNSHTVKI